MIDAAQARGRAAAGWRVHFGFNSMVDFCIWVLETDGLRIPPFDRHPDGHGLLRTMGLDPKMWRDWLHAVVALQAERECLQAAFSRRPYPAPQPAPQHDLPRRFNPPALWPGQPSLRIWLAELWQQYGPLALERRGALDPGERSLVELWLQEGLQEFHPRLEHLHIHLVCYAGRLAYPVPPHSLVLGMDGCLHDHATLWSTVREAVEELASA